MSALQIPLQVPEKLLPIFQPKRFKVMYGGRGGAKSHTVAQALLSIGMLSPKRILCGREIQKSLAESSMQVLKDYIEILGLGDYYDPLKTEIRGLNGTVFNFIGLQNHTVTSLKSYEGYDIFWGEEAHSFSKESCNVLIPTIRKAGSELWFTMNPDIEEDYVYDRFIKRFDPDAWVCQVNWRDNPWFGTEMDVERLKMKAFNDDLYQHIWEGKCRSAAGLIFKRVWFKFYDTAPARLTKYMASDYAVSEDEGDFTEHGVFGLDTIGDLYVLDWWSGQTSPEKWIDSAAALLRRHKPDMWFEESGVIRRAMDAAISKRMRELGIWIYREALPSASSKAARALGFAVRASAGTVWLPRNQEWATRLVNQLCAFNGEDGRVDDMVDVCSLIARGLDQMRNASPAPIPAAPEVKFGTKQMFDMMDKIDADSLAKNRDAYR